MSNKKITVVFLHDAYGDYYTWKWLDKRLKKKYDCIYLNLPGYNGTKPLKAYSFRSLSEWVAKEIKKLNVKDYVLVGHGMGAKLALFAGLVLHDLQPTKLILIAPSSPKPDCIIEPLKTLLLKRPSYDNSKEIVVRVTSRKLNNKRLEAAIESYMKTDELARDWWIHEGIKEDITWAIKNLEIPTFVIHGKKDSVSSLVSVEKDVLPLVYKSKLIVLGRTGHTIPLESPRKLGRLLKRILNKKSA